MTHIDEEDKIDVSSVEQIEYNDWGAKLKPGHENYWAHIGYIAHFLASLLEGWQTVIRRDPTNNDKQIAVPVKYNSIIVNQFKEKFGQIRVYCTLTEPELVDQLFNDPYNKWSTKMSLEQFREHSLKQDMLHYRSVYFIMKQCFPHYWNAISHAADYCEILYDTKEDYIKAMEHSISRTDDKWRPTHLEREKDFIFDLLKWK